MQIDSGFTFCCCCCFDLNTINDLQKICTFNQQYNNMQKYSTNYMDYGKEFDIFYVDDAHTIIYKQSMGF